MDRPAPLSLRSLVTPVTNSVLSPSLSPHLLCFHPSILHLRPPLLRISSFNFGSRSCFLSIFANRRDLKSRKQPLSRSFFPASPASRSPFSLSFFPFMFPLKENLPCDPAKSARAFYVPDDPHGIVSRSSADGDGVETDVDTSSECTTGTTELHSMTNQSHAPVAGPMSFPAADAVEEKNSWHAPLGSSESDGYRTNKYRMRVYYIVLDHRKA